MPANQSKDMGNDEYVYEDFALKSTLLLNYELLSE
jgi:hypothetical protein